jgi:hypothetical protein
MGELANPPLTLVVAGSNCFKLDTRVPGSEPGTCLPIWSLGPCYRGSIFDEVSLYTYPFFQWLSVQVLTFVGISTSHQKVVLEIDFSGSVYVCLYGLTRISRLMFVQSRVTRR